MRFFDTSEKALSLGDIEDALRQVDPAYRLEPFEPDDARRAALYLGDSLYAEIEINAPGDELFEAETGEMLEFLKEAMGAGRERVEGVLKSARRTVAVSVLGAGRTSEESLAGIDPLWVWLFSTRSGLLHADAEGFYDGNELILEETW
jgi:hypothetical protein